MTRTTIHRFTSDSKMGRKIAAASTPIVQGPGPSREQQEWNARVEEERRAKKKKKRGFQPFSLTLK